MIHFLSDEVAIQGPRDLEETKSWRHLLVMPKVQVYEEKKEGQLSQEN